MKHFYSFLLLVFSFICTYSQVSNVKNELSTGNTQIFYFEHVATQNNHVGKDFFKPYLAYYKKNGALFNPSDYLMDSFIFLDFYYFYHKATQNKPETPFKGKYEARFLDSYLKDVFKRTKLPILKSDGLVRGRSATIVANERSALSYKVQVPNNTNSVNLKFTLNLESGDIPSHIQHDFLIGWEYF